MKSESEFILGDCLKKMKNIDENSIDFIFCDPPFNQNYRFDWDKMIPLTPMWDNFKRILKEDGVVAMTGQQPFTSHLVNSNLEWFRYEWIWDKQFPRGMHRAKQQPMRKHENIIIFSKNYKHNYYPIKVPRDKPVKVKNDTKNNKGSIGGYKNNDGKVFVYTDKNPTSIIIGCFEGNRGVTRYHPTQKPVTLMEYLIKTYTEEGDTVLDPCYGSCATGVACKKLNRKFIGIEKDDTYYELGKKRVNDC